MTRTELAAFDGGENRPAYVAVNGKIYDVSASPRWQDGLHPPDHRAGQDLTEELAGAPHVRAVIERFPVVGTLEEEALAPAKGGGNRLLIGAILALVIGALILLISRLI